MTSDLTRRNFMKQAGLLVGTVAVSPTFVTRADATPRRRRIGNDPRHAKPAGHH